MHGQTQILAIGLAANGTGNIASFNAINIGNSPVLAIITVTPTFTGNSVAVPGSAGKLYDNCQSDTGTVKHTFTC